MLTRRRVLLAKVEASEGTPETLTATDNPILVKDLRVNPNVRMYERELVLPTLSLLPPIPAGATATVSFTAEVKGAGSAYSATNRPPIAEYLRACGFAETIDTTAGAEKAIYTPASSGIPSLTIGVYEDGIVHTIAGARGTVRFSGRVGEVLLAEFEFTGVWMGVQDAPLPSPTYDISNPPAMIGGQVTVDTYTPVITSFSLDIGNSVDMREDFTSSTGYRSALITARNPRGSFDPEMTPVATYDWFGKWKDGVSSTLSVAVGSVQYNRVKFDAPNIRYAGISEGDRSGILTAETEFVLAMNTGDDELTITFD